MTVQENVRQVKKAFGARVDIRILKKVHNSHNFTILNKSDEIDDLLQKNYTKQELDREIL